MGLYAGLAARRAALDVCINQVEARKIGRRQKAKKLRVIGAI